MKGHEGAQIEIGQHVAVAHHESLVDALGREPDSAGSAERLVFDHEPQLHVAEPLVAEVVEERVGEIPERQHRLVDPVLGQPVQLPLDERDVDDRQQRLRGREGQRPKPRPGSTDEDDCFHGVVVVVLPAGAVVVVESVLGAGGSLAGGVDEDDVEAPGMADWPFRSLMLLIASSEPGG